MRELEKLVRDARAARSALRQAIERGRGDELALLNQALATVEEADELLNRVRDPAKLVMFCVALASNLQSLYSSEIRVEARCAVGEQSQSNMGT